MKGVYLSTSIFHTIKITFHAIFFIPKLYLIYCPESVTSDLCKHSVNGFIHKPELALGKSRFFVYQSRLLILATEEYENPYLFVRSKSSSDFFSNNKITNFIVSPDVKKCARWSEAARGYESHRYWSFYYNISSAQCVTGQQQAAISACILRYGRYSDHAQSVIQYLELCACLPPPGSAMYALRTSETAVLYTVRRLWNQLFVRTPTEYSSNYCLSYPAVVIAVKRIKRYQLLRLSSVKVFFDTQCFFCTQTKRFFNIVWVRY